MSPALFEDLLASIREGGAILRGEVEPSRRFVLDRAEGSGSSPRFGGALNEAPPAAPN